MNRIVVRHDAATAHDLDLRRAVAQVFSCRHQVLIDTINNHMTVGCRVRTAAHKRRVRLIAVALISMATGLRKDRSRRKHSRPD